MLVDNGGEVASEFDDFELFRILDRSSPKRFARTFGQDIVRENDNARLWWGFPPDVVAIASNGAGDYLVFDRAAPAAVLIWRHETMDLTEVAADFSDLEG